MGCMLCPRRCGADRAAGENGVCGAPAEMVVARAALHFFEEPPISGTRGSGTVFFSGCSLGCFFCQNGAISHHVSGRTLTEAELQAELLRLAAAGAHNINLVTATHYADRVARVLEAVKPRLGIPVVWNTGGYERVETLRMLDGLVDIYLPDFKFADPTTAALCADAPDYPEVAAAALAEMYRQTGAIRYAPDGTLARGVVVRHLVLPGGREESKAVLARIAQTVPADGVLLSLMRQYTPDFAPRTTPKRFLRRVTTFEYEDVRAAAERLGFAGFSQEKTAATAAFTPDFGKYKD